MLFQYSSRLDSIKAFSKRLFSLKKTAIDIVVFVIFDINAQNKKTKSRKYAVPS